MIAKEFEDFLLAHLDNYLIPSDQVAIFIDTFSSMSGHFFIASRSSRCKIVEAAL